MNISLRHQGQMCEGSEGLWRHSAQPTSDQHAGYEVKVKGWRRKRCLANESELPPKGRWELLLTWMQGSDAGQIYSSEKSF